MRRFGSGFTIFELLIAVAVVGILTALAMPAFKAQLIKSRRADAYAALSAVQLAQERFRANQPAYASLLTAATTDNPPGLGLPASTANNFYTITLNGVSATGYTALATAVAGSSQASDGNCVQLSVRLNVGTVYYGSAAAGGNIAEPAINPCWSR